MRTTNRRGVALVPLGLRVGGSGLLFATGALHLDLYLTGYRSIPTIAGLFLLQVITAFALGAVVLATGSRLAAAAGAGFVLSTLGGYLITLVVGLFGFREIRTEAGIVAGVFEVAAFAMLGVLALTPGAERLPAAANTRSIQMLDKMRQLDTLQVMSRLQTGFRASRSAVAALSLLSLVALGTSSLFEGPASAASSSSLLKLAKIDGASVVVDSRGFTLYWFGPDTPTMSSCNGSCTAYWPPLIGRPVAGAGLTGALGTIKRSDGITQPTYNRHPLYTYIGDGAPGQANGNDLDINGGVWHEVPLVR
jgi:predicted lipoprotein with Yx(FWY)xxD motif